MYLGHAESKMRQVCRAVGSESLGSGQELAVVPHSTCLTMAGESMGWGDGPHSLSATKFQLMFLLCVTVIPPFVPPPNHTHTSHIWYQWTQSPLPTSDGLLSLRRLLESRVGSGRSETTGAAESDHLGHCRMSALSPRESHRGRGSDRRIH